MQRQRARANMAALLLTPPQAQSGERRQL